MALFSVKPQRFIWMPLLLLSLVIAVVLITRLESPVTYQGKDVWQWTAQLNSPSQTPRDEAAAALRQLGLRAVPELLRKLRAEESIPRKLRLWLASLLPTRAGHALTKDLERISFSNVHCLAAAGLGVLGTNASAATPVLLKAMRGSELQLTWDAAGALIAIGEFAVPGLIPLLEEKKIPVRHAATYALGEIGPPALPAVPALIRHLSDANPNVRASTRYSLSRIGPAAGPMVLKLVEQDRGEARRAAATALTVIQLHKPLALSALAGMSHDADSESRRAAIEAMTFLRLAAPEAISIYLAGLNDTDSRVRLVATRALGDFPSKSQAALPALTALQQSDTDETVRKAARAAADKIAAVATADALKP